MTTAMDAGQCVPQFLYSGGSQTCFFFFFFFTFFFFFFFFFFLLLGLWFSYCTGVSQRPRYVTLSYTVKINLFRSVEKAVYSSVSLLSQNRYVVNNCCSMILIMCDYSGQINQYLRHRFEGKLYSLPELFMNTKLLSYFPAI